MSEQIQEIVDVATGVVTGIFGTMDKPEVFFKQVIQLDEFGTKRLVVVGSLYRDYDDGHCVAVLNPDTRLDGLLHGGVGYPAPILKDMVRGHCDGMALVMCRGRKAHLVDTYKPRKK